MGTAVPYLKECRTPAKQRGQGDIPSTPQLNALAICPAIDHCRIQNGKEEGMRNAAGHEADLCGLNCCSGSSKGCSAHDFLFCSRRSQSSQPIPTFRILLLSTRIHKWNVLLGVEKIKANHIEELI